MANDTHPLTMRVVQEVVFERQFQDHKWSSMPGQWTNDAGSKLAVLVEEVGEVGRALCDGESAINLRNELVQVAAVAVRWAETITAELDKATADRAATSAGTVETKPEPRHNLAKYREVGT